MPARKSARRPRAFLVKWSPRTCPPCSITTAKRSGPPRSGSGRPARHRAGRAAGAPAFHRGADQLRLERGLVDGLIKRNVPRADLAQLLEFAQAREARGDQQPADLRRDRQQRPQSGGRADDRRAAPQGQPWPVPAAARVEVLLAVPGRDPPDTTRGRRRSLPWLDRQRGIDYRAGTGLHTTSDLPQLLLSTGSRLLEEFYTAAASPLKSHSRERVSPTSGG